MPVKTNGFPKYLFCLISQVNVYVKLLIFVINFTVLGHNRRANSFEEIHLLVCRIVSLYSSYNDFKVYIYIYFFLNKTLVFNGKLYHKTNNS